RLTSLARLGIDLGTGSILLRYSRDNERDADLNGARIMQDTGYDAIEMARFFEKLQSEGGQGPGRLANFLADHPSPGNRVRAVEDEVLLLPRASYRETEPATLKRVK